uniref:Secreted protein n=1 Tax=Mesocestoides corti TaxID=53468 RepID=A0A5K3G0S3_MESCO
MAEPLSASAAPIPVSLVLMGTPRTPPSPSTCAMQDLSSSSSALSQSRTWSEWPLVVGRASVPYPS